MRITFIGKYGKQETDNKYYIAVESVYVFGKKLKELGTQFTKYINDKLEICKKVLNGNQNS